jgi:hypothetical protein
MPEPRVIQGDGSFLVRQETSAHCVLEYAAVVIQRLHLDESELLVRHLSFGLGETDAAEPYVQVEVEASGASVALEGVVAALR